MRCPVFSGVCVVEAPDVLQALARATEMGINPGGEVMAIDTATCSNCPYPLDTLLTREDIESMDGGPGMTLGELKELIPDAEDRYDMIRVPKECNDARR